MRGFSLGGTSSCDGALVVVDESGLDLGQLGVFGDRDVDGDDAVLDLEQELVLHLAVLTQLLGRHRIVADGVVLARQFGQPVLLLRLEHDRGHDPGELLGVLRGDDLLVLPAAHDAERAAEGVEVAFLEQADRAQLPPEVVRTLVVGRPVSRRT